ncbi:MAG: iron-containing redox enzyme family protein [Byssovorax sp.]
MELAHFIPAIDIEASALNMAFRANPSLQPFFSLDFSGKSKSELRDAYLRLLKITADYVAFTIPMLVAAGESLRGGSDEDRAWSERFLSYAADETDDKEKHGHQVWAMNDMLALGAPASLLDAPVHPSVTLYRKFFVDDARLHPYAILGAKGVLEHVSLYTGDDLVKGLIASGIEHIEGAVSFFAHHGVLDIDHVREGNENLARIESAERRGEVLQGAFFTSGSYRSFLRFGVG